ncbi:hypothetical protein [Mesorhizobium sp. BH1-1-4]|uniref:hypothetical protein n=1 Tax=Mesorhizobium sp. BH1-1-4 TaxID=2876662 RepID=UPI001CD06ED6|nr:hypothetical protein [Mesorhizobium sp. BH1-1-4]MBZ9992675.1 hypothetical protein [Mesorhizobium sp. BH1-1-4]
MALQNGEAVRRYSLTPRPITAQRIERALDRVAEIIVARGDDGEAWLALYEHLERALQDHRAKEERLAAVRFSPSINGAHKALSAASWRSLAVRALIRSVVSRARRTNTLRSSRSLISLGTLQ